MTSQEGVDAYFKERYNDVIEGLIVEKIHQFSGHHLDKFLAFVGKRIN